MGLPYSIHIEASQNGLSIEMRSIIIMITTQFIPMIVVEVGQLLLLFYVGKYFMAVFAEGRNRRFVVFVNFSSFTPT